MLYNKEEHSKYVSIAGKISIAASIVGLAVFLVAFMVDIGSQEISKVSAQQTASTTLTVLNTPPSFTLNAYEVTESSTSTPTNSGDIITWRAIGSDSNGAPYFLLLCSTNASPTANSASGPAFLGTAPPDCGGGVQWGVSAATPSDSEAFVSTTTASTAISQFDEVNEWFAWVCDDDPFNPRCNSIPVQGYSATNSSPFHVNNRPNFTSHANDGPVDPGGTLVFSSVSSDPDTVGGEDQIYLVVCQGAGNYSTTTNSCTTGFLASTTISLLSDASATYTLASIVRDDVYPAYGFLVDEHGHEATENPIQANFTVNNVAPEVLGGDIDLNGGLDLTLTIPEDETTGFTLDFTVRDANSCVNAASTSEIVGYNVAVFRTSYGTTTCDTSAGSYDPNYCYPSGVPTTTWNLSCTAATSSCTGPSIDTLDFSCSFPLWFVADPTDAGPETPAAFAADTWSAAVAGVDDDALASSLVITTSPVELISFTALDLITAEIPYGELEPGDDSGTLSASTSVKSVGNTGLDQEILGDSMCGTYTSTSTKCAVSASSTIPEDQQKFSSSSLAYTSPGALALSSTTWQEVELDVNKTTSTSTPNEGTTYWGIAVPITITLAGNYQGMNTFMGRVAEAADW